MVVPRKRSLLRKPRRSAHLVEHKKIKTTGQKSKTFSSADDDEVNNNDEDRDETPMTAEEREALIELYDDDEDEDMEASYHPTRVQLHDSEDDGYMTPAERELLRAEEEERRRMLDAYNYEGDVDIEVEAPLQVEEIQPVSNKKQRSKPKSNGKKKKDKKKKKKGKGKGKGIGKGKGKKKKNKNKNANTTTDNEETDYETDGVGGAYTSGEEEAEEIDFPADAPDVMTAANYMSDDSLDRMVESRYSRYTTMDDDNFIHVPGDDRYTAEGSISLTGKHTKNDDDDNSEPARWRSFDEADNNHGGYVVEGEIPMKRETKKQDPGYVVEGEIPLKREKNKQDPGYVVEGEIPMKRDMKKQDPGYVVEGEISLGGGRERGGARASAAKSDNERGYVVEGEIPLGEDSTPSQQPRPPTPPAKTGNVGSTLFSWPSSLSPGLQPPQQGESPITRTSSKTRSVRNTNTSENVSASKDPPTGNNNTALPEDNVNQWIVANLQEHEEELSAVASRLSAKGSTSSMIRSLSRSNSDTSSLTDPLLPKRKRGFNEPYQRGITTSSGRVKKPPVIPPKIVEAPTLRKDTEASSSPLGVSAATSPLGEAREAPLATKDSKESKTQVTKPASSAELQGAKSLPVVTTVESSSQEEEKVEIEAPVQNQNEDQENSMLADDKIEKVESSNSPTSPPLPIVLESSPKENKDADKTTASEHNAKEAKTSNEKKQQSINANEMKSNGAAPTEALAEQTQEKQQGSQARNSAKPRQVFGSGRNKTKDNAVNLPFSMSLTPVVIGGNVDENKKTQQPPKRRFFASNKQSNATAAESTITNKAIKTKSASGKKSAEAAPITDKKSKSNDVSEAKRLQSSFRLFGSKSREIAPVKSKDVAVADTKTIKKEDSGSKILKEEAETGVAAAVEQTLPTKLNKEEKDNPASKDHSSTEANSHNSDENLKPKKDNGEANSKDVAENVSKPARSFFGRSINNTDKGATSNDNGEKTRTSAKKKQNSRQPSQPRSRNSSKSSVGSALQILSPVAAPKKNKTVTAKNGSDSKSSKDKSAVAENVSSEDVQQSTNAQTNSSSSKTKPSAEDAESVPNTENSGGKSSMLSTENENEKSSMAFTEISDGKSSNPTPVPAAINMNRVNSRTLGTGDGGTEVALESPENRTPSPPIVRPMLRELPKGNISDADRKVMYSKSLADDSLASSQRSNQEKTKAAAPAVEWAATSISTKDAEDWASVTKRSAADDWAAGRSLSTATNSKKSSAAIAPQPQNQKTMDEKDQGARSLVNPPRQITAVVSDKPPKISKPYSPTRQGSSPKKQNEIRESNLKELDEYWVPVTKPEDAPLVQCLKFYNLDAAATMAGVLISATDCQGGAQQPTQEGYEVQMMGLSASPDEIENQRLRESLNTMSAAAEAETKEVKVEEVVKEDGSKSKAIPDSAAPTEKTRGAARIFEKVRLQQKVKENPSEDSTQEAPDISPSKSYVKEVTGMKLQLDEDLEMKEKQAAVRRARRMASENISITSIDVPSSKGKYVLPNSKASDSTTEAAISESRDTQPVVPEQKEQEESRAGSSELNDTTQTSNSKESKASSSPSNNKNKKDRKRFMSIFGRNKKQQAALAVPDKTNVQEKKGLPIVRAE